MSYGLKELLDMFRQEGAVALYLADGFAPALAIPCRPSAGEIRPSAVLYPVEGPVLNRAELGLMLEEIKASSDADGGCYHKQGLSEFHYHKGSHDLDVFVFASRAFQLKL